MSTLFSISRIDKSPNFNSYGPEGQGFESLTACQERGYPIRDNLFSYFLRRFEPLTSKNAKHFLSEADQAERMPKACTPGVRIPYGVPCKNPVVSTTTGFFVFCWVL